jgi:hypothetical protein
MEAKALRRIILILLLIVQIGGFSCVLLVFLPTEIVLRGIARPSGWVGLPLKGYKVEWVGESGEEMSLWVEPKCFEGGDPLNISLPSQKRPLVFAYPVLSDGRMLKPGAFIYPFDLDAEGRGFFSYVSGYEAEVASVFEKAGLNPWVYPLERLGDDIVLKGKDPWDCAPWQTATLLMAGKFRLSGFPAKKYRFNVPRARQWWPLSPFGELGDEGNQRFAILAEGITTFVSNDAVLWVSCQGGEFNQAFQLCPP